MILFQNLTREELQELLLPHSRDEKQARYRAQQVFRWVYQRYVLDWDLMTDLAKELRAWLRENVTILQLEEHTAQRSVDGTQKFLWKTGDGKTIESVIIPAALREKTFAEAHSEAREEFAGPLLKTDEVDWDDWERLTACISSQVGCAMACKFCLTGIQGLDRSLSAAEIVTQVLELRRRAPITNIVFMGMGEPLHNLDNVSKACKILLDIHGMNFSKRKVTVSTSGLVPAIRELGKRVDVSLAISLNATTDEIRSQIMPVNRKWPLAELMQACREFPLGKHRKITFEYVLLKGINDSLDDAKRITQLVKGLPCKINLIPFNEHPGADFKRPDDTVVRAFHKYLADRDYTVTVRISRGRDVLAACGQLRSLMGTARGTEKHRDYRAQAEAQSTSPS